VSREGASVLASVCAALVTGRISGYYSSAMVNLNICLIARTALTAVILSCLGCRPFANLPFLTIVWFYTTSSDGYVRS